MVANSLPKFFWLKTKFVFSRDVACCVSTLQPCAAAKACVKGDLLSPVFDGQSLVRENVEYCVELIKQNPLWVLSLQAHKLIDIQ